MDPRELNQMFEQLAPTPEQMQRELTRLLQEERKGYPMRHLKKMVVIGVAAALMLVTCAAAVVIGIDQRLIDFLGGGEQAQELLAPGAQPVDVTTEDNGASLHVTQVLMDRYTILILSDFTAPEGTVLDMAEDVNGDLLRGFSGMDGSLPSLLDSAGEPIDLGQSWSYYVNVLDDGDPLDNHLTLLSRMELSEGIQPDWDIQELSMPAVDLIRFDPEAEDIVTVYSGDWSCQFPVSWQDMGRSMQMNQVVGQVDDVNIAVTNIYLSPMTLQLQLERETPVPLHSPEAVGGVFGRWVSALNVDGVTLTTKDGQTVPLTDMGNTGGDQELNCSFLLNEITDLAQLQTLTLCIGEGSIDIPLDGFADEPTKP